MTEARLQELLGAIRRIEGELAGALGEQWPAFSARLADLADEAPGRPPALVEAQLRALFAAHPGAYLLLRRELDRRSAAEAPQQAERTPDVPAAEAPRQEQRGAERPPVDVPASTPVDTRRGRWRRRGKTTRRPEWTGMEQQANVPPPRYVNVALLRSEDFRVVPGQESLRCGQGVLLRLDIGALSPESVVENAAPFPAPRLVPSEHGHWLQVAVVSTEFDVPSRLFDLFLPRWGASWVCRCRPGGAHRCRPAGRDPHLLVPLTSPRRAGSGRLRIAVYYENNVVQSQVLTAHVAEEGGTLGYSSRIDYTMCSPRRELERLPRRSLNILSNQGGDGTHTLAFKDGPGEVLSLTFAEGQLAEAMAAVRGLLLDLHRDPRSGENRLRDNGKGKGELLDDLARLARQGYQYWTSLFVQQGDRFRRAAAGPSNAIQVARVPSSLFVFPWPVLYDIPLDAEPRPCPMLERWAGRTPLVEGYPTRCPFEAEHEPKNTLCPFGFWGFRHTIEHPPSTGGRELPQAVTVIGPAHAVVVRSTRLSEEVTMAHLAALGRTFPGFTLTPAVRVADVVTALGAPELELAYFYCHDVRKTPPHGGAPRHFLEIGDGDEISPEQIVTWHLVDWAARAGHWEGTAPLVFLNGCHTAELTPQSPVNFVDSFASVGAGGVVGTEIMLEQRMASEAAERFFAHFVAGVPVGEAVRRMRLDLLGKGNVLGLAYTAYCSGELRLVGLPGLPLGRP